MTLLHQVHQILNLTTTSNLNLSTQKQYKRIEKDFMTSRELQCQTRDSFCMENIMFKIRCGMHLTGVCEGLG